MDLDLGRPYGKKMQLLRQESHTRSLLQVLNFQFSYCFILSLAYVPEDVKCAQGITAGELRPNNELASSDDPQETYYRMDYGDPTAESRQDDTYDAPRPVQSFQPSYPFQKLLLCPGTRVLLFELIGPVPPVLPSQEIHHHRSPFSVSCKRMSSFAV